MSKYDGHTPGPWRIGNAGQAVFGPPNGKPSPLTIVPSCSRADARLIADTPTLLAQRDALAKTLQCALVLLERLAPDTERQLVGGSECSIGHYASYHVDQARAALAALEVKP